MFIAWHPKGMIEYMIHRRDELSAWPKTQGGAVETCGIGSGGNTAHLNRTVTLAPLPKSMIAIIKGKKK